VREGVIHLPHRCPGWWRRAGLDNALRHGRTFASSARAKSAAPSSYTPLQVAEAYNFPQAQRSGQTIGIIELAADTGRLTCRLLQDLASPLRHHRGQLDEEEQAVDASGATER